VAAAVAVAALGVMITPALSAQFGLASTSSLAANGPAVDTLHALGKGGIGTGVVTPTVVLTTGDGETVADAVRDLPGVRAVSVAQPGRDGITAVDVIPDHETVDSDSVGVVDAVRAEVAGLPGYAGITGAGSTIVDYRHAVYDRFPYVIAVIALITFLLLVRTFRSLLLPLKAVLLNLVSLAAVFGAATWFWQQGHGSEPIFDIAATGAMTFWIPPLIFAFLFGLSMDYEVFILARMREEYDATGSTRTAVVEGLGRTGRLITSAALILFFAFLALTGTPGTDVKVFATALGAGILIDATVVRALLVPALVSLFGRWNWYLPNWVATVLRVEPSPLAPRHEPAPAPAPAALPEQEPAVS
jgi:RND superfamily putative drug exporter